MKLPTGGGLSQQISGRIRLDISGFKADAAKLAREAKKSAESVSNAYQFSGMQIKSLDSVRKSLEAQAKAGLSLEEQKRKAAEQSARIALQLEQQRDQERARLLAKQERENAAAQKAEEARIAALRKADAAASAARQRELAAFRKQVEARYAEEERLARKLAKEQKASAEAARKAANKPYEDLRVAVGEARTTLLAFTAAATGLVYAGLRAADSIDLLTIRYRELARGQEEGLRLMRQVEKVAREMNLPIRATQQSFLGLIPAVREANGDLEQYANVALRLATLNSDSRGGVEGAIYAIREALSSGGTDLVSLSERFNIPRKALRQAIEDTGDLAKALDLILTRYGATDAAAKANARTLGNLAALVRDTVSRMLEKTFAGALETAKNLLDGLNAALESTPPEFINIASGAILASGAMTGLITVTELLTSGWKRGLLAMVAYGSYMKKTLIPNIRAMVAANARAVVGVAAVTAGTFIGREAVRAIGRGTGNERLANYELSDAFNTIKQLAFLMADTLLSVIQSVVVAITKVVASFKTLGSITDELGLRFTILIADLGIAVQQFLGAFGNQGEIDRLTGIKTGAEINLSSLIAERDALLQGTEDDVTETFRNIRLGIYNALFPVEQTSETAAAALESFNQVLGRVELRYYDFLEKQGDAFAEGVDNAISFQQELYDLLDEGDIDGLESRLRGLERERQAIQSILPELERQAEYSDKAAERLAAANARLDEITNSLPDFLDALDTITGRAAQDSIVEFAKNVKEARDKYTSELSKALDEFRKEDVKSAKDEAKKREALRRKEAEATDTYQKAILKAEESFRKRMIDIQRNYLKAVTLAASSLDAAGVVAAIQARVEGRREANEQLTEQRQQALERLHESRLEAAQQLQDMRDEFKERRAEIVADRLVRLNELRTELTESLQAAATAHITELNEINSYYTRRYADLQNYLVEEQNLMYQKRREMLQAFAREVILPSVQELFGTSIGRQAVAYNIGQIVFQISGAQNPAAVAQAVNQQLLNLAGQARGGSAGLG